MIKITAREVGILEFSFGILFLALSIFAIVYTNNSFNKEIPKTLDAYSNIVAIKYNVSRYPGTDSVAGLGIGNYNTTALPESDRRAFTYDLLNSIMIARTNVYANIPIFVLAVICALAVSFIMIFQGIYHWNKE